MLINGLLLQSANAVIYPKSEEKRTKFSMCFGCEVRERKKENIVITRNQSCFVDFKWLYREFLLAHLRRWMAAHKATCEKYSLCFRLRVHLLLSRKLMWFEYRIVSTAGKNGEEDGKKLFLSFCVRLADNKTDKSKSTQSDKMQNLCATIWQ